MTAAKNHGEPRSPGEETDHYHLLQIDPDAPHDLIVEAYWYVAGKLRAEQPVKRGVERELDAVNAAYTELVNPERRHAYDATVPRVQELRRARAEAKAAEQPPPLLAHLLGRPSPQPPQAAPNYYAVLSIDPEADALLIDCAHTILRSRPGRGDGAIVRVAARLAELDEARSVLLDSDRRAAYDLWLSTGGAPTRPSAAKPPAEKKGPAAVEASPPLSASMPAEPPATVRQSAEQSRKLRPSVWHTVLRLMGRAAIATGRFLKRCAAVVVSAPLRAILWASAQGRRGSLALARAARRLAEHRGERRSRERGAPPADLLNRRLLGDAVPHQIQREQRETEEKPTRARLLITEASGKTDSIILGDKPITLGSDRTCEVVLEAEAGLVAAAHAQIWFAGDHFVIRSLSPRHATRIGGNEVNWAILDDGDEIEIGRCRIRFETMHPSGTVPDFLSMQHSPR